MSREVLGGADTPAGPAGAALIEAVDLSPGALPAIPPDLPAQILVDLPAPSPATHDDLDDALVADDGGAGPGGQRLAGWRRPGRPGRLALAAAVVAALLAGLTAGYSEGQRGVRRQALLDSQVIAWPDLPNVVPFSGLGQVGVMVPIRIRLAVAGGVPVTMQSIDLGTSGVLLDKPARLVPGQVTLAQATVRVDCRRPTSQYGMTDGPPYVTEEGQSVLRSDLGETAVRPVTFPIGGPSRLLWAARCRDRLMRAAALLEVASMSVLPDGDLVVDLRATNSDVGSAAFELDPGVDRRWSLVTTPPGFTPVSQGEPTRFRLRLTSAGCGGSAVPDIRQIVQISAGTRSGGPQVVVPRDWDEMTVATAATAAMLRACQGAR